MCSKEDRSDGGVLDISKLPTEIFSLVLRYLDSRSLVNASQVNNFWQHTCRKDPVLRIRIKKQETKRKRLRWCRARYGEGTVRTTYFCKAPKDVILKRKIRIAKIKMILTLRTLRDLWQGFHDSLMMYM